MTDFDSSSEPLRAETRSRSLAKTLSWRVIATGATFAIAWLITGDATVGAKIGAIEAGAKMFLYYFHERAWSVKSHPSLLDVAGYNDPGQRPIGSRDVSQLPT